MTGGRLEAALRAQATLGDHEQDDVLVDRLDGYVNFAFRAMKAERDGATSSGVSTPRSPCRGS